MAPQLRQHRDLEISLKLASSHQSSANAMRGPLGTPREAAN